MATQHKEVSEIVLMNQVGHHTKVHSYFCMYFDTMHINFTTQSSW